MNAKSRKNVVKDLQDTLVELIDHQGGCERIKNTEFPDAVAFFTKVIAWAMAAMLAVSVMESDRGIDVVEALVVAFMMAAFVLMEKVVKASWFSRVTGGLLAAWGVFLLVTAFSA